MSAPSVLPPVARSWRGRPLVSLLIALIGYGLTFWAWILLGALHGGQFTASAAVAVVVGSAGRIPVGTLTDRYGARVVLPAIAVCAGLAVLALAAVRSGPLLAGVTVVLGVAGTTFAAGSAMVVRAYPREQRGMALSVFGAGMALASAVGLVYHQFVAVDVRHGLVPLAVGLVGYAVLAAVVVKDRGTPSEPAERGGFGLAVLRWPATRYLSAWYAIAFGGLVALALYLPAYVRGVYHVGANAAIVSTAACLTVAGACRPLGGWACRRHDPTRILRTCFAGSAVIGLVLAFAPPFRTAAVPALVGLAGCLGLASGVVQAALATTVPPERAGTVAGTVGAVGGLAGVLPPLLLVAVEGINGSYGIGLTVLAAAALAGAAHLYLDRGWIGTAIAFPTAAGPSQTATTVVALPATHDGGVTADQIAPLVTLATRHELIMVSAAPDRSHGSLDGHPLVTGLRLHLPRHRVIVLVIGAVPQPHEVEFIAGLVDDGALPVVLTAAANLQVVALHLAAAFRADHVLCLGREDASGILLQPPWAPATQGIASRSPR